MHIPKASEPAHTTSFQDLVSHLKSVVSDPSTHEGGQTRSWMDLATLALLAESGELKSAPQGSDQGLHQSALDRLEELVGKRPKHYWKDLLHHAQILGVLQCVRNEWKVLNLDAEILGATRREAFPPLCAAWLKHPAPIPGQEHLSAPSPSGPMLRLEMIRLLGLLEPNKWYPMEAMGHLFKMAAQCQKLSLDTKDAICAGKDLVERVFLVMGAVDIDHSASFFALHEGLQLPPLPPEASCYAATPCRAEAYRRIIAEKMKANTSWRHVAPGLMRCLEVRRSREAVEGSIRYLQGDGWHLETTPEAPFKDCLFLARLGRLVPACKLDESCKHPGSYVFDLDVARLRDRIMDGMSLSEVKGFLEHRCRSAHLNLLQGALQEASLAES